MGEMQRMSAAQTSLKPQQHPPNEAMKRIRTGQASELFLAGQPIQAACCHLSIEDIQGALNKLWMGNELELNLALRLALDLDRDIEVDCQLSKKCEAAGNPLNCFPQFMSASQFLALNWVCKTGKYIPVSVEFSMKLKLQGPSGKMHVKSGMHKGINLFKDLRHVRHLRFGCSLSNLQCLEHVNL